MCTMYLQYVCIFIYNFLVTVYLSDPKPCLESSGIDKVIISNVVFVVIGQIKYCCCCLLKYTMFLELDMQVVNMKII